MLTDSKMEKMKATFRRLRFGSDPDRLEPIGKCRVTSLVDLTTGAYRPRISSDPENRKWFSKIGASTPNLFAGKLSFLFSHFCKSSLLG